LLRLAQILRRRYRRRKADAAGVDQPEFAVHVEPTFFPRERHRALFGVALYAFAGIAGWALSPTLALLFFLALPVFYGITSEGLVETRVTLLRRLDARRGQRQGLRPGHTATGPTDARE
jgi:hypothetical protein